MNPELTKKLYDRFPDLYRQHTLPMSETCMCWGFTCDDGWFDIIWVLSLAIEDECKQAGVVIEAVQVKEKFGGLRFYTNISTDRLWKLIDMAERLSIQICEICGDHGSVCSNNRLIKTLCKNHATELKFIYYGEKI
jgi:hypothetical protein